MALGVGDLVDAESLQPADAMPRTPALDEPVQLIRQRRRSQTQQARRGGLRHPLAVRQQQVFEAVADPGRARRPGGLLEATAVGRAADLPGGVVQPHGTAADADIAPAAGLQDLNDLAPEPALGTAAAVLLGLDRDDNGRFLPASFEPHAHGAKPLEVEQLGDELHSGHRSPSLFPFGECLMGIHQA